MGVGAYEAARHDARDALHLDPESAYAFVEWRLLAEAEFRLGSFDAALVAAKRSAARNQNYVWAYVCMAAIQGEQGDVDAACMNLDRAYALVPDLAALLQTDALRNYDLDSFLKYGWSPPTLDLVRAANDGHFD